MKKALAIALFPLLLSCSQAFQNGSPPPELDTTSLPQMNIAGEGNLTLSKNSLEKEYLLQASFIDTSGLYLTSPSFFGTQSRIIYFTEKNHSLFMMESNKGRLSSEELPAEWILAQFKIIQEDDNKIVFDFNEGMKNIFVGSDWYSSDWGTGPQETFAVNTPHSFLKEVLPKANRIVIRQVAQLEFRNIILPVEVVYYLENYNPDPDFKPILNPGFDRVGFFEANPQVRESFGDFETNITRWNIKKPIVYAISDNTPKEFIDAIKEGVLYWNKAFGAEIVQTQMAPAGVTAPDANYNVIQWVTNHYAGFAYADAQMDPRTGEILHAQIYLPSSFTAPLLSEIEQMEKSEGEQKTASQKINLGLKGFTNGLLCEYPLSEAPAAEPLSLKMTQDFLRHVVAHEVGHTLGLRHNFASSNYSELLPQEIRKKFETYLKEGNVDLKEKVGSSVMDYLNFPDRILNGKYIGDPNGGPLPYDAMAITFGYYGAKPEIPLEETLFCPDTLAGRYADCQLSDGSSHPLLSAAGAFEERIENLPNKIAQLFLEAKTNFDPQSKMPVGNVPLPEDYFAWRVLSTFGRTIGLMKDQARSLLVKRMDDPETDPATTAWIDQAIDKGGGLKKILSFLDQHSLYQTLEGANKKFSDIVASEAFRKEFSDQEISVMKKRAKPFFEKVANKVFQGITEILSEENNRRVDDLTNHFRPIRAIHTLEELLGNWAEFIITNGAEVLPTFDGDLRLLATNILLPNQGPTPDWEKENRANVLQKLLLKLEQRYGTALDAVNPAGFTEEKKNLYEMEVAIVQVLLGE